LSSKKGKIIHRELINMTKTILSLFFAIFLCCFVISINGDIGNLSKETIVGKPVGIGKGATSTVFIASHDNQGVSRIYKFDMDGNILTEKTLQDFGYDNGPNSEIKDITTTVSDVLVAGYFGVLWLNHDLEFVAKKFEYGGYFTRIDSNYQSTECPLRVALVTATSLYIYNLDHANQDLRGVSGSWSGFVSNVADSESGTFTDIRDVAMDEFCSVAVGGQNRWLGFFPLPFINIYRQNTGYQNEAFHFYKYSHDRLNTYGYAYHDAILGSIDFGEDGLLYLFAEVKGPYSAFALDGQNMNEARRYANNYFNVVPDQDRDHKIFYGKFNIDQPWTSGSQIKTDVINPGLWPDSETFGSQTGAITGTSDGTAIVSIASEDEIVFIVRRDWSDSIVSHPLMWSSRLTQINVEDGATVSGIVADELNFYVVGVSGPNKGFLTAWKKDGGNLYNVNKKRSTSGEVFANNPDRCYDLLSGNYGDEVNCGTIPCSAGGHMDLEDDWYFECLLMNIDDGEWLEWDISNTDYTFITYWGLCADTFGNQSDRFTIRLQADYAIYQYTLQEIIPGYALYPGVQCFGLDNPPGWSTLFLNWVFYEDLYIPPLIDYYTTVRITFIDTLSDHGNRLGFVKSVIWSETY